MAILFFSTIFMICFIMNGSAAIPETAEALRSFLFVVLPSIFPLCALSDWMVKTDAFARPGQYCTPMMQPLFRLSGICILPFLVGLVGSYPSSAKTTATLYENKQISLDEAIVLTTCTNHAGPMFVISVIGLGFLGSPLLGFIIWFCQILAGLVTGVIFSRLIIKKRKSLPKTLIAPVHSVKTSLQLLSTSIAEAAYTMVPVGGTILFFTALCASMEFIQVPWMHTLSGIARMLLEMTAGSQIIHTLTGPSLPNSLLTLFQCMLYAGVVSWGGVSVHLQIVYILSRHGIPCKHYLLSKMLQTVLAMALTGLIVFII